MKNSTLKCAMLLAAGIVFSCVGMAAKTYTLSYNLKKGDAFIQTSVMEMKTEMDMGGQKMEMPMTIEISVAMEVTGVENDAYNLKCGYKRFKMNSNSLMGQINLDSEKNESEGLFAEMSKMFENLTKESFTVKMDKFGKVLAISDYDKLLNLSGIAGGQLEQQFSEENFKHQFRGWQNVFPEKSISIGESWESQLSLSNGLNLPDAVDAKIINTLKSVNDNVAVIESAAVVDVNKNMSAPSSEEGEVKMIITGNVTMAYNINLKNGIVIDGKAVIDMNVKMNMSGNEMAFKIIGASAVKSE